MKQMNIVAFSGGKDSAATVALCHIHNIRVDKILFSEVMFNKEISGELPEHIDFIKNRAIPQFEEWGFETEILHADKTYMDCFNQVFQNSTVPERNGKRYGFPMSGKCIINRDCKIKPIQDYLKKLKADGIEVVQFIGIAVDEPERLERLDGKNKISILAKYGYTEQMAFDLAAKYNLLSPIYGFSPRGGCWFCPNARYCELKHLRNNHKNLWNILLDLENEKDIVGDVWNTRQRRSIHQWDEAFQWEERQMSIFDFI